jgi:hypothetical protein
MAHTIPLESRICPFYWRFYKRTAFDGYQRPSAFDLMSPAGDLKDDLVLLYVMKDILVELRGLSVLSAPALLAGVPILPATS